jgi:hypothetical protein
MFHVVSVGMFLVVNTMRYHNMPSADGQQAHMQLQE